MGKKGNQLDGKREINQIGKLIMENLLWKSIRWKKGKLIRWEKGNQLDRKKGNQLDRKKGNKLDGKKREIIYYLQIWNGD